MAIAEGKPSLVSSAEAKGRVRVFNSDMGNAGEAQRVGERAKESVIFLRNNTSATRMAELYWKLMQQHAVI